MIEINKEVIFCDHKKSGYIFLNVSTSTSHKNSFCTYGIFAKFFLAHSFKKQFMNANTNFSLDEV